MPGTVVFRPLEAKLTKYGGALKDLDSFCSFKLGDQQAQGDVCEKGGKNPHWNESITLQVGSQSTCTGEIQNKEWSDDNIGKFEVNLSEVESRGRVQRWYPIVHGSEYAGEILVETSFTPDSSIQHEKAHQGNIPSGIDEDRYRHQYLFRENEPLRAEIAETNEFGDYQPFKALPFGGFGRDYTSGNMEHGQYFSGQQTSYGEAFPMAHKSVGFDIPGTQDRDTLGRKLGGKQDNPWDYSLYWQQAFEPHDLKITGNQNASVVEKAYLTIKADEKHAKREPVLTNPNPLGVDKSYLSAFNQAQVPKRIVERKVGAGSLSSLDNLEENNTSMASTTNSENVVSLPRLDIV